MSEKKFEFNQEERKRLRDEIQSIEIDFGDSGAFVNILPESVDSVIDRIESIISERWVSDDEITDTGMDVNLSSQIGGVPLNNERRIGIIHGMKLMRSIIFKTQGE